VTKYYVTQVSGNTFHLTTKGEHIMKIQVTKGITAGVGKFETIRMEVSAEFETNAKPLSQAHEKEIKAAFDFLDEQLNTQIADIQDTLKADSVFKSEQVVRQAGLPSSKTRERK
jgi:hypothetical protein